MTKEEYLSNTYKRIEELKNDEIFRNNLSQIRARATQEETSPGLQSDIKFTFSAEEVWQYCEYIFSEGSLLLREKVGDQKLVLQWTKDAAETFEFLSKFAEEDDKPILLLNSAICYHIAGYQANAQCLSKVVERQFPIEIPNSIGEDAPDIPLTNLFRAALVNFLRRDLVSLQHISNLFSSFSETLQTAITEGMTNGKYGQEEIFNLMGHAFFQNSLVNFATYCLEGKRESFDRSLQQMAKSHIYFQEASEVTFSTLSSELRTVLQLFDERSAQSVIARVAPSLSEDKVWQSYLLNLAIDKSIVEFWQSQLKAIENGILTADDSFIVQMPTSAGKTLVAELSILTELTKKPMSRCLYLAPYRALVNEIQNTLSDSLGVVGYRVSNLIGGFEFDAFQDFLATEADVLIATPEKADLFLRTHPDYFDNLSVVVVDEGHVLDEGLNSHGSDEPLKDILSKRGTLGRGAQLENLIERLKRKYPDSRYLFLSAVMPDVNANDFVEWLSKSKKEPLRIERSERPSRQLISKFQWVSSENGEIEFVDLPLLPNGRHPWVPRFIKREQLSTGETTPTGLPQRKSWPDLTNKGQTTATLAVRYAISGPVLIFCAMPRRAKLVAQDILKYLGYLQASNREFDPRLTYLEAPDTESFLLASEWLGDEHVLTKSLKCGIGVHYGGLPDELRQAIETDFRNNRVAILICTNTLAQGVNLPIKTALIDDLVRVFPSLTSNNPENVRLENVTRRDFWNICGRAGRAGKETEGQVVFVTITDKDKTLFREYKDDSNLEEIVSPLYRLLEELTEKRIDQDYLIGYLDTSLLSLIVEEVVDTKDEESVRKFLNEGLVGIQARRKSVDIAPLVATIQKAATWVSNEVPTELRPVFSSTGLRVSSCQLLEREIDLFLQSIDAEVLEAEEQMNYFNDALLQSAFISCRDLPEMKTKPSIHYAGPEDEYELVRAWVKGKSVREIRSELWQAGDTDDLSEFISDRFGYKLPWGMNGFLRILAFKLGKKFEDLPPTWQNLPSMLKVGVDNLIAAWAGNLGISRQLSMQLSEKYSFIVGTSFVDFFKWLADLPTELVLQDLTGSRFEKQRLINIRNRIIPNRDRMNFVRGEEIEIISTVQGINYEDRYLAAMNVKPGDEVSLHREPENTFDPNAIRISYKGQTIGYVQSSKAQIIYNEMRIGRVAIAFVKSVTAFNSVSPIPKIEVSITMSRS